MESLETLGRYFRPFDMRGNIIEWSHLKHLVDVLRHFDMRGNIMELVHWKLLVDILCLLTREVT